MCAEMEQIHTQPGTNTCTGTTTIHSKRRFSNLKPGSRWMRQALCPCVRQWAWHHCCPQPLNMQYTHQGLWVVHPCSNQWALRPFASQWVLQPRGSQGALCPTEGPCTLHSSSCSWALRLCPSQWALCGPRNTVPTGVQCPLVHGATFATRIVQCERGPSPARHSRSEAGLSTQVSPCKSTCFTASIRIGGLSNDYTVKTGLKGRFSLLLKKRNQNVVLSVWVHDQLRLCWAEHTQHGNICQIHCSLDSRVKNLNVTQPSEGATGSGFLIFLCVL